MKQLASFTLVLGVSLAACGGGEGSGSTGAGGSASTTTTASATGAGGAGGSGATSTASATSTGTGTSTSASTGTGAGGGAAAPAAPVITMVMPMLGALHVKWTNTTPDCDKILLSRKHDMGSYALAYTFSGAVYEKHDTVAVPPGSYCYKAVCEKGGVSSVDSNEKCGTP